MTGRREYPFVLAGITAAMSWLTVWSWTDLVEEPGLFLGPAFTGIAVLAVTGALLRSARTPWWAVVVAQLAVVTAWFHHQQAADDLLGGWLPTPDGLAVLADRIGAGVAQMNEYVAPVEAEQAQAPVYLLATALMVALTVDLIGCGLRQTPWAGLPVLVALTVPISVLDSPLPTVPLAGVMALYLASIAYARSEEVLSWGQVGPDPRPQRPRTRLRGAAPAAAIGILTTVAALMMPAFVPVTDGLITGIGGSGGGGRSGTGAITLNNPLVDLRRDLEADENIPLLDATTRTGDTSYLRMTVLDLFDGASWIPSVREFPRANRVGGRLPDPDGITPLTPGTESEWRLRTTRSFFTSWLPVPFPTRSVRIDDQAGDWRYDSSTLDIASAARFTPAGISYSATGFSPAIDPADLAAAGPPPAVLRSPMTQVPDLDPRVAEIARDVTADGSSDYAKAVLLQRWFRSLGGFTYSLDPAPGAGMSQLVAFLTTDKVGYCEQFAAAMAVMARSLGIPARVVVGFLSPETVTLGNYRYTSSDLHAWPEIYFSGSGWVRFEPTPSSRTGQAPAWTQAELPAPDPVAPTPAPTAAVPPPPDAPLPADAGAGTSSSPVRAPIAVAVLALAGTVLLLLLPRLVRRSRRRQRLMSHDDGRAEAEGLWGELHATAIDLGVPWHDGGSVRTIARSLAATPGATPEHLGLLDTLVDLVERARYQRRFDLDAELRPVARRAIGRWTSLLAASVSQRDARRARWFPRSVLAASARRNLDRAPAHDRSRDLTEVGG